MAVDLLNNVRKDEHNETSFLLLVDRTAAYE